MKKRVWSFVFIRALVLSLCPGTVFAASSGEGKELVVKEVPFQVNPLYADVIDPSDFETNSGYTLGPGSSARAGEYLSEEETAEVMREEMEYYERKGKKEHLPGTIVVVLLDVIVFGVFSDNGLQLIGLVLLGLYGIYRRNEMITYIEARAFVGSGQQ